MIECDADASKRVDAIRELAMEMECPRPNDTPLVVVLRLSVRGLRKDASRLLDEACVAQSRAKHLQAELEHTLERAEAVYECLRSIAHGEPLRRTG
jgi:hypothetical protein